MLSRNLSKIECNNRTRRMVGTLIDELVRACDPNLDGNQKAISGNKFENLFREHLFRILADDTGTTKIEVNFKRTTLNYNHILKILLKHVQFAWDNMAAMRHNNGANFDEQIVAEYNEASLLIRSLLNEVLIEPGEISSLYASNMARGWRFTANHEVEAIEVWDPKKLTKLAKPAPVDAMLRLLKDVIR